MDIVGHRKLFYALSGALAAASIAALAVFGLPLGIAFTGGSLLELEFPAGPPSPEEVRDALVDLNVGEVRIQPAGDRALILRLRHIDESTHREIVAGLQPPVLERRFDSIGPTIGQELRSRALVSIGLVLALILGYVAWAFRKVSKPVQSWKYGLITITALVHDILIPAGVFALLGRFFGFEAGTLFVTALLTVLGFSVHDTIVVFDRVRENLGRERDLVDFAALVNRSVRETLTRSLNTSLALILTLAAILLLGGASTWSLALTLLVGLAAGTYSSIFIASPLLVTWHQFQVQKRSA